MSYFLFHLKNQKTWHLFLLAGSFTLIGYLNFQIHNSIFGGSHKEFFFNYYAIGYISTYCVLAAFAYLLYSLKRSHNQTLELQKAIGAKEKAELSLLKAQINPHFLFNTLNAIYNSAVNKEDKTPELILKLSDNFRYIIADGRRDKVSLKEEIDHLKNYIFLQKERLGNRIEIEFIENIDDYEQKIAPLILIIFVENMFKHSSLLKGKLHELKIELRLVNSHLSFKCTNPLPLPTNPSAEKKSKGTSLGIENVSKRLEIYYPNKYKLQNSKTDNNYIIDLKIYL